MARGYEKARLGVNALAVSPFASHGLIALGCELGFGHSSERWQKLMHGAPYKAMGHVLVLVPVDVTRAGHLAPRDLGMARLHFRRQAARRFRDDLETSRDGVKRPHIRQEALVVESLGKGICEIDVEKNVRQAVAFGFRLSRLTTSTGRSNMSAMKSFTPA